RTLAAAAGRSRNLPPSAITCSRPLMSVVLPHFSGLVKRVTLPRAMYPYQSHLASGWMLGEPSSSAYLAGGRSRSRESVREADMAAPEVSYFREVRNPSGPAS